MRRLSRFHPLFLAVIAATFTQVVLPMTLNSHLSALVRPREAVAGKGSPESREARVESRFGASTSGGVAGTVLRVTTLGAEGPGSLRSALEAEEPRLIVFEVGGVIDLGGHSLEVRHPFVTIAGQTAPDPGITLIRGE